jgi:hypothetical protein
VNKAEIMFYGRLRQIFHLRQSPEPCYGSYEKFAEGAQKERIERANHHYMVLTYSKATLFQLESLAAICAYSVSLLLFGNRLVLYR